MLVDIADGKMTLGAVPGLDNPALIEGLRGNLQGHALGAAFIAAAFVLPDRLSGGHAPTVPAE